MSASSPGQTFRSKEISKSNVVDDMVASNSILYEPGEHPDHCIVIKYIPYVGDSKRAMDEYTSEVRRECDALCQHVYVLSGIGLAYSSNSSVPGTGICAEHSQVCTPPSQKNTQNTMQYADASGSRGIRVARRRSSWAAPTPS
jgi:hypothetical protein